MNLEEISERLSELAEADEEVQMRVDDLIYQEFGDGKRSAAINNQGIAYQFEKLAERFGVEKTTKVANELLEEFN